MTWFYRAPCCMLAVVLFVGITGRSATAQSPVLESAKRDLAILTADSLYGRGYQPDGAFKAARYIRDEFQDTGLSAPDHGFFQSFPLTVDVVTAAPTLYLNGDSLQPGRDFIPHGITGGGRVSGTEEIVSVGAGLVIPRRGIDAYEDVDVRESVVILEEEVPDSVRSDSSLDTRDWSVAVRIEQAVNRGAAAVLISTNRLIYSIYPYDTSVPVFSVKRSAVSEPLETISLSIEVARDQSTTSQNVIGLIEGTTRPDSLIILSAHYDHMGSWGETVYFPGANDNASGTTLLLALARYFEEHPLPYTVACIAFSGEEHGLQGSRFFAEHPSFDLSKVRFLLNFDMVASGTNGISAVGGVDFPEEFRRLEAVNDSLQLGPLSKRKNVPNSDHYPLTERGVHGFFLYSRGGGQPYHHVNDIEDTLDWEVFTNVYRLAVHFLESL